MIRLVLLALLIGVVVAIKYLPWYASVGLIIGLLVLLRLAGGALFSVFVKRLFNMKSDVMTDARVDVHEIQEITKHDLDPERVDLAEATRYESFYVIEATITPNPTRRTMPHWEPGELQLLPPDADPETFFADGDDEDEPSKQSDPRAVEVLWIDLFHPEESRFVQDEGFKFSTAARLRVVIGTRGPCFELTFNYYFEVFGHVDLARATTAPPEAQAPPKSALHARAGVHMPPPESIIAMTPAPRNEDTLAGLGAKAPEPQAPRPQRPGPGSPPEPAARPKRPAPAMREQARKRVVKTTSNPTYRYASEPLFDIYSQAREHFRVPPLDGLDGDAFRPVGRHEAPERFGRNILPPNGIPDPSPEVLDVLLHANYCYRVRVSLVEPANLSYLARTLTTAASLAREVDGVIRDVQTGLVLTYDEARRILKSPSFAINDHVLVHTLEDPGGQGLWVHTHGMAKFGRTDLEMRAVPEQYQALASHAILTVSDYLSQGNVLKPAETLQLGNGFLTFTRVRDEANEEFPYGVLRITDFDPNTGMPAVGVLRWLTAVMA